jgi:ribonucleoside-diphosphate reductase alpha chain
LNRRENWEETVERYLTFMHNHLTSNYSYDMGPVREKVKKAIIDLKVMPSMRALMTSGKALERDNTCGYNCSFLPIDDPKAFDEAMFILLCGTGVGFSVERQFINQLP